MNLELVTTNVISILAEHFCLDPAEVTPDKSIVEDFGADSLDHVEIVMEMEEFFDLEVPDEESIKWNKVQDIITCLHAQIQS
jgi:acyl carrier protein